MPERPARTRTLRLTGPYHFAGSVGLLPLGRHDPCARFVDGVFYWATRTPDGPATLALWREPGGGHAGPLSQGGVLRAAGYGPGADWVVERADAVAGLRDDVTGFAALATAHPLIARLARDHRGLRLPATGVLFPRLMRAICEQKVTGQEAFRAYAAIVRRFGERAPGRIPGLWVPPAPEVLAATPYWAFHPLGLEQRRADTIRRAAREAGRLERCADSEEATARMTAIPGVGPWTAAEVVRGVYGDPDAVSVGDYHIPNTVSWALAGEPRGDDARMLELLEPFRGHRGRVCVLLAAAGIAAPRFGPRMPLRSFATY